MAFTFGMFQPGFPARVIMNLPLDRPYTTTAKGHLFLGKTLATELARKLGINPERVHLMDESASFFLAYDCTYTSGRRMCAYIVPDETVTIDSGKLLTISLEGARYLIESHDQASDLARSLLENVMHHKSNDKDFVYSVHRHITSVLPRQPAHSRVTSRRHDALPVLACRDYDALMDELHRRSDLAKSFSNRQIVESVETAHGSVLSLLDVARMLPPPSTLRCWLGTRDLLNLSLTSRSWWRWVTTNELPELLRHTMSHLTLPFRHTWQKRDTENDGYGQYQTGTTNIFCTLPPDESSTLDETPPARPSSWPSSADFIAPKACPNILGWMLSEERDSRMEATTASAVAPLIDKWYNEAFLSDPNTNTETEVPRSAIREFLLAALPLATAIGLFTSHTKRVIPDYGPYSDSPYDEKIEDTIAVCLLIPTASQGQGGATDQDAEVFWSAKWSTTNSYPY